MSRRLAAPIVLAVATLCVLGWLATDHPFGTYGTETDFYVHYAPDAARLAAGAFPRNTFQGPGYPLMLAAIGATTGDSFVAGKCISIVSAALSVFLAGLIFARIGGVLCGAGASLLLAVSPLFAVYGFSATTDAFFLMLALALLAVITSERIPLTSRMSIGGAIAGLAYLTRYNAVALVAAVLFAIVVLDSFALPMRRRWHLAALFIAVFTVTISPWLIANALHERAPLHNTNYLNVATEFFPELTRGRFDQDGTQAAAQHFQSFGEVLAADSWRVLRRAPANIVNTFYESSRSLLPQWIAATAIIGMFLARGRRETRLLIAMAILQLLLLSLTHWETRYGFVVGAIFAGFAAYTCSWLFTRGKVARVLALLLLVAMAAAALMRSQAEVRRFLRSHPIEVISACEQLQARDIHGAVIVARKPHLPSVCGQEWLFFPPVRSLDELHVWLQKHRADYLVFGRAEAQTRPELSLLLDPRNAPPWLQPLWAHHGTPYVIYRPVSMPLRAARSNGSHPNILFDVSKRPPYLAVSFGAPDSSGAARGNSVRIRGCPAAVSDNDPHSRPEKGGRH